MSKIPKDSERKTSLNFQKRLIELINEQDLSNAEFCEQAKISYPVISRATIYSIIPSTKMLIKLADFFDIPLKYLLGESNDPTFYKSESPASFSERLCQLADEKDVKFSEISHKMPFAYSYFYDWIRTNSIPSLENLEALADYFQVSLDYLTGRTDYKDQDLKTLITTLRKSFYTL